MNIRAPRNSDKGLIRRLDIFFLHSRNSSTSQSPPLGQLSELALISGLTLGPMLEVISAQPTEDAHHPKFPSYSCTQDRPVCLLYDEYEQTRLSLVKRSSMKATKTSDPRQRILEVADRL